MSITHHQKDIDAVFSWEDGDVDLDALASDLGKVRFFLGGRAGASEGRVISERELLSNFFNEDFFFVFHFSFNVL